MLRVRLSLSLVLLLATSLLMTPVAFGKGGGGFGGGRSFSGGGRSVAGGVRPGGFGSGRSFSTPRSAPEPGRGTFNSSRGFGTRFDNDAASAQRAQSSRRLYERANGMFNGGRTGSSERVGPVDDETIRTRPSRQEGIFGRYYRQPVTIYHDSFSPWFWLWLLDRSQHDRDLWVYNHRDEMDQSRYNELVQKDADLERRLHDMEQQGVAKDPSYTPPGVDQDLMYDDKKVEQAHAENQQQHPEWGMFFGTLAVIGGCYLVFFVPMFKPRRRIY